MPRRKDDPPNMVTFNVSLPVELKEECLLAKNSGIHRDKAESTFIRYLLEIGLRKYQKVIQPAELSEDEKRETKTPQYGPGTNQIIRKKAGNL